MSLACLGLATFAHPPDAGSGTVTLTASNVAISTAVAGSTVTIGSLQGDRLDLLSKDVNIQGSTELDLSSAKLSLASTGTLSITGGTSLTLSSTSVQIGQLDSPAVVAVKIGACG